MACKEMKEGGYVAEFVKAIQDNGFETTLLGSPHIADIAKEDRDLALQIREYKRSRREIQNILTEEYGMDLG